MARAMILAPVAIVVTAVATRGSGSFDERLVRGGAVTALLVIGLAGIVRAVV